MSKRGVLKNGKVPTWAVREYLKRTGLSIVDINWKHLKSGVMQRILREEIKRGVKNPIH